MLILLNNIKRMVVRNVDGKRDFVKNGSDAVKPRGTCLRGGYGVLVVRTRKIGFVGMR